MPRHLQSRHPGDSVNAMAHQAMRYLARTLSMSALGAALAFSIAACNNQTGFSGSVGNTPNGPPLPSYEILGTVGTPFTATVSDTRSSWTFQGNIPLSVIICNNPSSTARIVATKTTSNNNLLSLEIISGNTVQRTPVHQRAFRHRVGAGWRYAQYDCRAGGPGPAHFRQRSPRSAIHGAGRGHRRPDS